MMTMMGRSALWRAFGAHELDGYGTWFIRSRSRSTQSLAAIHPTGQVFRLRYIDVPYMDDVDMKATKDTKVEKDYAEAW